MRNIASSLNILSKNTSSLGEFLSISKKCYLLNKKLSEQNIDKKEANKKTGCIIFTKDRPMQFYALLKSMRKNIKNISSLTIIFNASNEDFFKAYQYIFSLFPEITKTINDSSGFKSVLLNSLKNLNEGRVFFLVDDIIFTRPFDFQELDHLDLNTYVFSLRLGKSINYCYMQNKKQELPADFKKMNEKFYKWTWEKGKYDWSYPLSVDGHLFLTKEIIEMMELIHFKAPNTLEGHLQIFLTAFKKRRGVCKSDPIIFNNPCNKVQTEYRDNRSGDLSPELLLKKWSEGLEIDIKKFDNIKNKSVHEEHSIHFIARENLS